VETEIFANLEESAGLPVETIRAILDQLNTEEFPVGNAAV
jgi:hypothetical protein